MLILEEISEVDFYDTSYGYRPGKSCHEALATLGGIIATRQVNWVSDADIKGFFDNVCHERLVELLRQRVSDPKMLRLIVRFLKAGVMIDGHLQATEEGVPPTHEACVPGESLPITRQHLFALCVGRVVRARRETSDARRSVPNTFR